MSKLVYGLDFGTTNTAVAVVRDTGCEALPIGENGLTTIPSLLFFPDDGGGTRVGHAAIADYLNGGMQGRLMQSIKSFLPDKSFTGTTVGGQLGYATLERLISVIIRHVKEQADALTGVDVQEVVLGRPARFSSDPERDRLAEMRLISAAKQAGFKTAHVQKEPIAAAYDYERSLAAEEIAFVADFGGGTSDFTVMRLGPGHVGKPDRTDDLLGVDGVYVGGNDYDAAIMLDKIVPHFGSKSEYQEWGKWLPMPKRLMHDLCRWQRITFLKDRKTRAFLQLLLRASNDPEAIKRMVALIEENLGFSLFQAIERAKFDLSAHPDACIHFWESVIAIDEPVSRAEFDRFSEHHTEDIGHCMDRLLETIGVGPDEIDSVFVTGGTSYIPAVQQLLVNRFGRGKIQQGDAFISVAAGLALSGRSFA